MSEYRRTINRRTFVKALGGLIISLPFTTMLSPAHAAELPDELTFRVTVAVNDKLNGQNCLDTSATGYLTVVGPDQAQTDYPIQPGGQLQFALPTKGTSMLVLNVYGFTSRYFIAQFENGLLYLKNSDRNNRAMIYNWNAVENCYIIEYYQDNIYICGPADASGYFLSQPYQSLNPLMTARVEKIMDAKWGLQHTSEPIIKASCAAGCTPSRCFSWSPCCNGCSFCQSGGSEDNYGIPTNSTVSNGSSGQNPSGSYDYDNGCSNSNEGCDNESQTDYSYGGPQSLAEEDLVRSFQFRMTVTPSKAALQKNQQQADALTLPKVDFGLRAYLYSPTGDQISTAYVPMGGTTTTAEEVRINIQWVDDPATPHMIINSSWPKSLFEGSAGAYMFSAYLVTTDGQMSNKRTEYFESNA